MKRVLARPVPVRSVRLEAQVVEGASKVGNVACVEQPRPLALHRGDGKIRAPGGDQIARGAAPVSCDDHQTREQRHLDQGGCDDRRQHRRARDRRDSEGRQQHTDRRHLPPQHLHARLGAREWVVRAEQDERVLRLRRADEGASGSADAATGPVAIHGGAVGEHA